MLQISDLLQKTWEVYKERIETLIGITIIQVMGNFVFAVLALILSLGVGFSLYSIGFKPQINLLAIPSWIFIYFLFSIPIFLFNVWTSLALIFAVSDQQQEKSLGNCFGNAWSKLISGLWIDVLRGLVVFAGFLLLIVPGIIFAVWFSFSKYVLVSEGKKGSSAMKRSKELVEGHWWDVLGRFAFIALVSFVAGSVLGLVPVVGQLAASLLLPSFLVVYSYLLYKDLKEETEVTSV